ncbi:MAG: glutamine amidotransferase [Candidatus Saccharimonadales bacterium]
MSQTIKIAHLYPREMSIYGDMGNIRTLVKRLEWRGYKAEVLPVEVGEEFDFDQADIIFGGGGQDSGQFVVAADLLARGPKLCELAADGLPMLLICGLYQLFGREFVTGAAGTIPGIGVFAATTTAGKTRMIGNILVQSEFGRLVGFENHSGATVLDKGQSALGRVEKGCSNNTSGKQEGAVSGAAIGTYLHGPVLPKNPALADHLILTALKRRYGVTDLESLNDRREAAAAEVAARRPR